MKTALYARVSTGEQNCDLQLCEMREYAARRGWPVSAEYVDQGISGAKSSRPALDRLMADAAQRRFDVVLVWKLDRFGRSVLHMNQALAQLRSYDVRFIATTQGIDTDFNNPMAGFLLQILSAVSEFERALIRDRVTAGLRSARAKGTRLGRPVVIADVQKLARMHGAGMSLREIAAKTGLSKGTVSNRLKSCADSTPRGAETISPVHSRPSAVGRDRRSDRTVTFTTSAA